MRTTETGSIIAEQGLRVPGSGAMLQVKGQRRITFDQFVNAMGIIADKKGQAVRDVVQPILDAGGPSVTGTKAGYVKFHDDKVKRAILPAHVRTQPA